MWLKYLIHIDHTPSPPHTHTIPIEQQHIYFLMCFLDVLMEVGTR